MSIETLTNEMKRQVFLKLRSENYRDSLRLEGLVNNLSALRKHMKTIVRVFPDYQSTGLWYGPGPGGANMCESEVSHVIPEHMLIALKYWHHIWEFCICDVRMSGQYEEQWHTDGQALVNAMNACQDEFEFIYSPY